MFTTTAVLLLIDTSTAVVVGAVEMLIPDGPAVCPFSTSRTMGSFRALGVNSIAGPVESPLHNGGACPARSTPAPSCPAFSTLLPLSPTHRPTRACRRDSGARVLRATRRGRFHKDRTRPRSQGNGAAGRSCWGLAVRALAACRLPRRFSACDGGCRRRAGSARDGRPRRRSCAARGGPSCGPGPRSAPPPARGRDG